MDSGNNKIPSDEVNPMCPACSGRIDMTHYLSWEMMCFCNILCLKKYQKCLGVACKKCETHIPGEFVGKYYKMFQNFYFLFCSKDCLESFTKATVCCGFCDKVKQPDNANTWPTITLKMALRGIEYTIPVCSDECGDRFCKISRNTCTDIPQGSICSVCKCLDQLKIIAHYENQQHYVCGERCLRAFRYVKYEGQAGRCHMCNHYYSKKILEKRSFCTEKGIIKFCSYGCMNIHRILWDDKMLCASCRSETSNFRAVKLFSQANFAFCSLKCLAVFSEIDNVNNNKQAHTIALGRSPIKTRSHSIYKNLQQLFKRSTSLRNVGTLSKTIQVPKSTLAKPAVSNKIVQTDPEKPILVPVPVPIYVPTPMAMYSLPINIPVPIPIPIPVPVFIPTTKNTSEKIMRDIEKIRSKLPDDPYQAELLQIADTLAGQVNISDSEESESSDKKEIVHTTSSIVENISDIVLCESPEGKRFKFDDFKPECEPHFDGSCQTLDKVGDKRLVYNLGINAWKQWVTNRKFPMKAKTEILEMNSDELNYYLCLFVEELRKPNGDEYAPDTIYYLCLSIQYYLYSNGRSENIFIDPQFESFTDFLDKLAHKFCALYFDESNFIVTRVEEEHLWETKQLGCHSPQILLNSLIYFNTKFFYRATVDEHFQLTFHHIIRFHKKKSERNSTMLRFFPKSYSDKDSRIFVQEENIEDPVRCPVKLYEYYLSKCPENVKNNSSCCMYLVPEKYCISESPVWYSTKSIAKRSLEKVVNRFKMVKEVNVALLSNH